MIESLRFLQYIKKMKKKFHKPRFLLYIVKMIKKYFITVFQSKLKFSNILKKEQESPNNYESSVRKSRKLEDSFVQYVLTPNYYGVLRFPYNKSNNTYSGVEDVLLINLYHPYLKFQMYY